MTTEMALRNRALRFFSPTPPLSHSRTPTYMSTLLTSVMLVVAIGQVPVEQPSKKSANQLSLERILTDLSEIDFSLVIEPPEKLSLSRTPVLRWSNPIRNVDDAAV